MALYSILRVALVSIALGDLHFLELPIHVFNSNEQKERSLYEFVRFFFIIYGRKVDSRVLKKVLFFLICN